LAQRRSRRVGISLPLRYRQYDDVLPQPPLSVPSSATSQQQQPESSSPVNSADTTTSTRTSLRAPPFRTAKNIFGLIRQFFSSTPPSHDPEEVITLRDISFIPPVTPARPDIHAESHEVSFHPYPNKSSFQLGHWYWNGSAQKSHTSFKELIGIVGCPDFDPDDVRNTSWDNINSRLGASVDDDDEKDEWEDEDAGWRKTQVTIKVPFSRTTAQPGALPYVAAELYYRPLISVIREKLSNAQDNELFHYEPYLLRWSAPHLPCEVNIQGELYTSPAFMNAHSELQSSPGEPGCDLPRVVVAVMFSSDATHLTSFGNAKLWPVYMYFGNESKYRRCKPSCNLCNHVAYFHKLPDSFKDFTGTYTQGKGVSRECATHCHRELFQAQWRVLLDAEFLQAYEHGIVILCCDGIKRRFYPRVFTYSADYPEKVLIATIRQLGGCPCPRCLIPMGRLHNLGMTRDRQQRVTLARSDASRSQLVKTARGFIYEDNYGVDSTAVEDLLKRDSWVPTSNAFSDCLSSFGFNMFIVLVVDLLHEFELGVWRMLLIHLLRILCAFNKELIHELDRRYRLVPPFGSATIRRFSANTSEMSNMAARNFEDLLQCSIPVFDGLLPGNHNKIVMNLLFIMAHWHGLAKLRMHSDLTLDILDQRTTDLGNHFRQFKATVCATYHTQELDREVDVRSRRLAREAAKRSDTTDKSQSLPIPRQPRRKKSFNFRTYKFHALGDYVASIRHFGTTDSYSTEPGELEHRTPKGWYRRTDRRAFVRQLTQIEQVNEITSDPEQHHFIGQSEKMYDDFGHYLRSHAKDPAMKDFLPRLKDHILDRLEPGHTSAHLDRERDSILFKRNRLYHHNLAKFNYTTYDVRRAQDTVACHIIPTFSRGQRSPDGNGLSPLAKDKDDWHEYYINSFADRDTLMRYHYGLGVGHVYSHEARITK
ncbi:hypothetical protein P692DRAFT_20689050, partial [Suillus brevipes Sb2]